MNTNDIRVYTAAAVSTVAVVIAAKSYVTIHKQESAKRKEIRSNMELDIQAIHNAHDVMMKRIENGEIRSIAQLAEATQTEVAFHKIAIREDQ